MTDKKPISGPPVTRKKYTPAFKAECVRQALEQAVPSSAEREEIKRLRAELKRGETERDILKKAVTIFAQPQS